MRIDNLPQEKIVNESGEMSATWQTFFDSWRSQSQINFSDQGYRVPPQNTAFINSLNTTISTGAILYDNQVNQFKGCVNGKFLPFISSAVLFPQTVSQYQLLYAPQNNVVAGLPTAVNGILVTDINGNPSIRPNTQFIGNYSVSFNFTGSTNVTFPTSGTLATTTQIYTDITCYSLYGGF
jgi:hypothetical protein